MHDPLAEAEEAFTQYGLELSSWDQLPPADALVLAVPHREYLELGLDKLVALLAPEGIVIDVKSRLDRAALASEEVPYWRL